MKNTNNQPSQILNLIASLSCGISIVVSTIYIALCSVAIYFRSNCEAGLPPSSLGSEFFIRVLHRLYFKRDDCHHAVIINGDVTQERTVFTFTVIVLVISIICLISAVGFIVVLNLKDAANFIVTCGYIYVAVCIASLIADIVAAVYFGMDFATFTSMMNNSSPGVSVNYPRDMYRLSALFLMTVSLKLFVAPVINTIFIVLLVVYLIEFGKSVQTEGHSIHKVGPLNGYDHPRRFEEPQSENSFRQMRQQQKRNDDPWQQPSPNVFPYKGPHINPVFINDEDSPRILNRDNSRPEPSNPTFDRSYSWQHNQPSVASRPFSYLEDSKPRAPPVKAPSPVREPQWSRDPWQSQSPPVPAPDYSPEAPRRLKSALKSSYM